MSAKPILIIVALTTLTACSTVEIIHEPVPCLGQPVFPREQDFTDEEVNAMTTTVYDKIRYRIVTLRERINAQCEVNKAHNQLHGDHDD